MMSEEQVFEKSDEPMESEQVAGGEAANGEQKHISNDDDRKMFVGGLSWETSEYVKAATAVNVKMTGTADLKEYMSQFGKVESCNIKKDLETNRSRGFGFVVFEDSESPEKVLAKSEHKLQGKNIDPKKANPKARYQDQPINKIFVAKVSPSTTEEQIKEYFSQWGKIVKVETLFDKEKNQRRNFLFVEFENEEGVNKVLNQTVENPDYKHKIGNDEVDIRKATPGNRGRGRGGFFRGSDQGGRGSHAGYGGYGDWNNGYGGQAYSGYGGYGSGGYGGSGYGYGGYGGYSYDPSYGYGGAWGSYDPSYYGYSGYDYSGGWAGYADQSGQQAGGYGKTSKSVMGGSGYRPY